MGGENCEMSRNKNKQMEIKWLSQGNEQTRVEKF